MNRTKINNFFLIVNILFEEKIFQILVLMSMTMT